MENSSKKSFPLWLNILISVSIMVILLVIDIVTKLVIKDYFGGIESYISGEEITVINDFFWIHLTYNKGALAGAFGDLPYGRILLSILSIIGSIGGIVFYVLKHNSIKGFLKLGMILFIPGCTGNLIDRVNIYSTPGVIDFLKFKLFGFWDFPVFNFADMCLTVSIFAFIIHVFITDKKEEKKENEAK